MTEIKVFIDQLPNKDKECCSNCANWQGLMSCGECGLTGLDIMSHDTCCFFEIETEERKREREL